jgi:hypothetical protein
MNAKSSVFYPAVIVVAVLAVVGLVLGWLQFSVTIEPTRPDTALLPEKPELQPQSTSGAASAAISSSSASTTRVQPRQSGKQDLAQSIPQSPPMPGALRVSNQTDQPLRVALLARQSEANSSAASKPKYGEPVHWDFAPEEGSSQGLVLSLPDGNLKLHKGDIVVAFAQDGSRRYWGPFVVAETDAPIWNRKTSEWQLILQP